MALKTLRDQKINKVTVMPLTRDIAKMSSYLSKTAEDAVADLQSEQSTDEDQENAWVSLAQACLAQIVMFNRRRSGEVSKMKVSMYRDAVSASRPADSDIHAQLSEVEHTLCRVLTRIEIPGKRGNFVPILLTHKFRQAVDLLLEKRHVVNVAQMNDFVFARPNSLSHIRGSDVLRTFASECGAEAPHTLRSTKLRKHVATISQVINLKNNELDVLAQFLGHNIKVHRDYYRLPSDVLQTAKIAKILMALDNGEQLAGKSLDDIHIDLEEGCHIYSFSLYFFEVYLFYYLANI